MALINEFIVKEKLIARLRDKLGNYDHIAPEDYDSIIFAIENDINEAFGIEVKVCGEIKPKDDGLYFVCNTPLECEYQMNQSIGKCHDCSYFEMKHDLVLRSGNVNTDEPVVGDPPLPPIDESIDPIQITIGNTFKNRDMGKLPTQPEQAMRFNEGKPQWSLVHFKSLEPMVRVLEFGALKYAPRNWQKPMDLHKILESMQRHLAALFDGEEVDSESGISHMGHIQCNALFYNYHNGYK